MSRRVWHEGWDVASVAGQRPQAHAPPHAQPPAADGPDPPDVFATNENWRRTRSLPQDGQATATSTEAVMGRFCSNQRSHARHA